MDRLREYKLWWQSLLYSWEKCLTAGVRGGLLKCAAFFLSRLLSISGPERITAPINPKAGRKANRFYLSRGKPFLVYGGISSKQKPKGLLEKISATNRLDRRGRIRGTL